MLELKDVHTHYGLSHVLQGVSLRVDAGETGDGGMTPEDQFFEKGTVDGFHKPFK